MKTSSRFAFRIGYVPLIDSAPLLMAKELKIFEKFDVPVRLSREPGWSSVRDKLSFGDLDAAHAPVGLSFALSLGSNCLTTPMRAPLMISTHGNAITLSRSITPEHISTEGGLKAALSQETHPDRLPTFAAVHPWSSHSVMLHAWLARHGLRVGKDAEVLYLPPPVMTRNLKAGTIDGFCVGEPWNSHAILENYGWCAIRSSNMANGEIEKALIVNEASCQNQADLVCRLVAALLEACDYCADPANDNHIADVLSQPMHLNCSKQLIESSLATLFYTGIKTVDAADSRPFIKGKDAMPKKDSANWLITGLRAIGTIPKTDKINLARIFDPDLYEQATSLLSAKPTPKIAS